MKARILVSVTSLFLVAGTAGAWPLDRMDTDDDGAISREEFMNKHEQMFDKLDADGDGQISADERRAAHEKFKERRKKHKEKMERHHDRMHKGDE